MCMQHTQNGSHVVADKQMAQRHNKCEYVGMHILNFRDDQDANDLHIFLFLQ